MQTEQQRQTLEYFSRMAEDWRSKAANADPSRKFHVIEARNAYGRYAAKDLPKGAVTLDVGCGTGELACDWARMGMTSIGVDFAPDMITLCKEKADAEKVPVEFVCASIFDYVPTTPVDLMVANGFIEYISLEEFGTFLDYAKTACATDGTLVVGSRNRLFNLFSLNAFTQMELDLKTTETLLKEALLIVETQDRAALLRALDTDVPMLPAPKAHPSSTGIEVSVRHQYTPGEMVRFLKKHGWQVTDLYPVHYHAAPPRFKETDRAVHISLAESFQNLGHDHWELIPSSSTFMVAARRSA